MTNDYSSNESEDAFSVQSNRSNVSAEEERFINGRFSAYEEKDDTNTSAVSHTKASGTTEISNESEYMQRRAIRILRNQARIREFGLIGDSISTITTSIGRLDSKKRTSPHSSPSLGHTKTSTMSSKRRSPRLEAAREEITLDLTRNQNIASRATRTSPRLASLSRTATRNDVTMDTVGEENEEENSKQNVQRRRYFTKDTALEMNSLGRARKKLNMDEYGEQSIIHPTKLPYVKLINGMVQEKDKVIFLAACDAFIRHYSEYQCCNYQKKSYRTKCKCMMLLLDDDNSHIKITQVCNSLWEFFTQVKDTQKLVIKGWLRTVYYSGLNHLKNNPQVCFILPEVYEDASQDMLDMEKNRQPFYICINALSLLYNYGYHKIKTLKDGIKHVGISPHGLHNKPSNRFKNRVEEYRDINDSLNLYFQNLKGEAETHATRTIREITGVGLRDEEIDSVELPSSYSKRQLYYKYCLSRGYQVKADHKGRIPNLKKFPVRTGFDILWPLGSVPKPVCEWKYFRTYWKTHFPKMRICPPSHDTCGKCWKFKNELGVTTRL